MFIINKNLFILLKCVLNGISAINVVVVNIDNIGIIVIISSILWSAELAAATAAHPAAKAEWAETAAKNN